MAGLACSIAPGAPPVVREMSVIMLLRDLSHKEKSPPCRISLFRIVF
jgi:hypothetical protein